MLPKILECKHSDIFETIYLQKPTKVKYCQYHPLQYLNQQQASQGKVFKRSDGILLFDVFVDGSAAFYLDASCPELVEGAYK